MELKHGIVSESGIYFVAVNRGCLDFVSYPVPAIQHIGDLIELGLKYSLTQLWILPGSILSHQIAALDQAFIDQALPGYEIGPNKDNPTLSTFMYGYPRNDHYHKAETVYIALPEYDTTWSTLHNGIVRGFTTLTTPKNFHACLSYLQALLGLPVFYAPSGYAIKLLEANTSDKNLLRKSTSDLTIFDATLASDIFWLKELTPDELAKSHLIVIDRNGMYLSGFSEVKLGIGDYTYLVKPEFSNKFAGLWHIKLTGTSPFNGVSFPHPTNQQTDTWVYTYTVEAAIRCGYQVEIIEAYIFTESSNLLRPLYEKLREARTALQTDTQRFRNDQARRVALHGLKRVYTSLYGDFKHIPEYGDKWIWKHRPDWYNQVIDFATFRMFLALQSKPKNLVGIYSDALYFVSNTPNYQEALPGFTISDQLGKYKLKDTGVYPMNEVRHLLTGDITTLTNGLADIERIKNHG